MQKCGSGFFGRPYRIREGPRVRAFESLYNAGLTLPAHAHERGHFCLVIGGEYVEWLHGTSHARGPFTLIYYPPDCRHAESHTSSGRHLNIDWNPQWAQEVISLRKLPGRPVLIDRGPVLLVALKAYHAFLLDGVHSLLSLEHLLLELLSNVARCPDPLSPVRPAWLERVIELLEETADQSPQLLEIAEAVRVHPSHLCRSFRKWTGCTLGEFRRRAQVERACRRLLTLRDSITCVAADGGFADQSHLTRLVRQATGFTPHALRQKQAIPAGNGEVDS